MAEIRKQLNPFEQAAADVRSGVDAAMKPKPAADPATPAASTPQTAEPLKNGATTMPGVNGPEAAPAAPIFPAMTDESLVTSPLPTAPVAAAKKATKAVPAKTAAAKATPAPKAPAKTVTAAKPETPKAAKPAAAKVIATKTVATRTGAKAEPKPAAVKKPAGAAK